MKISSKFKSIQSSIFCAVSILVLSAVLVVTVVSLRYTNSSIYENSVMYTQMLINICTVKKDMEPQRMKITVNTDSALWNSLKRS